METKDLALVSQEDLSLVENNSLNGQQLQMILKKTPAQFVKKRPAKGGGTWDYVTGGYIKKCLNLMFGWDWDFEIISEQILHGEVVVKGRLTCRTNGKQIVKMQFGNKDIMYRKQTAEEVSKGAERIPLSIGNDLKAATTDALKKCAAEIGIAADVYNSEDFREIRVDTTTVELDELTELWELKKDIVPVDQFSDCERVITKKETKSYKKLFKYLQTL